MILFKFHVCFITQIRNSMNTATYVRTPVFLYSSHYTVSNFYLHCKYRVLIFLQGQRQICNPIIRIIEATKNEFNGSKVNTVGTGGTVVSTNPLHQKIEVNNLPSKSLNPLKNFATKFPASRRAVRMPNSMLQENNIIVKLLS